VAQIGVTGLAVMGANQARDIARHGGRPSCTTGLRPGPGRSWPSTGTRGTSPQPRHRPARPRRGLGAAAIGKIFERWNHADLESLLIEITAIVRTDG